MRGTVNTFVVGSNPADVEKYITDECVEMVAKLYLGCNDLLIVRVQLSSLIIHIN